MEEKVLESVNNNPYLGVWYGYLLVDYFVED
jgi:hypothetical protein